MYSSGGWCEVHEIFYGGASYKSLGTSGIVFGNELDKRGSIPGRGERIFPVACVQTRSEAHLVSYPVGTGAPFPGAKRGRGLMLTTHPCLV
jgi:hypothetical protein